MSALAVNVVIQSSELARFCVEGSGFVACGVSNGNIEANYCIVFVQMMIWIVGVE
jgi:hypothetical protein